MIATEFKPLPPSEEDKIKDDLIRSRIQMLMAFPFFGILALSLKMEQTYSIPTAATDGEKFYYNPYFIKQLPEPQRNWIVVHEVLHPALKHLWRKGDRQMDKWNYACDYAIHCIMMEFVDSANYDVRRKLEMPEGCLYDKKFAGMSAEQIYDMLPNNFMNSPQFGNGSGSGKSQKGNGNQSGQGDQNGDGGGSGGQTPLDDHSMWGKSETQQNSQSKEIEWEGKLVSAAKSAEAKGCGNLPGFLKRLIGNLTKPQKDWRTLLHEFVQPEIDDYSFNPPDRRFSESDFMLPDFNDVTESVKNIKVWMDTSGSISDRELSIFYGEIAGAINQFSDRLSGQLGFFDHVAYPMHEFENVIDVLQIRPEGGGGTNFHAPFEWITKNCQDHDIAGIIMLTDGYCDFPKESIANGVPVLWVITNEQVTPPWGLHTTLKI